MKNILIIFTLLTIIVSCEKPKKIGIKKNYTVKVVFMDNKRDTIFFTSSCQPILLDMYYSNTTGSYLIINCDRNHKVASHVKYFSIISEILVVNKLSDEINKHDKLKRNPISR